MLATVAIPIIQTGAGLLNQPNNDDARRYSEADAWYKAAIAGDADALAALQFMTGRYGCATVAGTLRCGFATEKAKTYAGLLYDQATRVRAGATPAGAALPPRPDAQPNPVGNTLQTVSEVTGAAASGLGYPPRTTVTASATGTQWLLIGAVALVGVVLLVKFSK